MVAVSYIMGGFMDKLQTYYLRGIVNDPRILEELKEAGIHELDRPQNIWHLYEYIDKLIETLGPLGLVSASRTGAVAMTRGSEVFK